MEIIDTMDLIGRYFEGRAFSLDVWRRYAGEISPTLSAKCEADAGVYSFEADVLPVIQNALAKPDKLAAAHASFLAVTQGLEEKIWAVTGATIDAVLLLYLGLCGGAGWATELDGRPAVLLGLEKIVELDWGGEAAMAGLVTHELGHLWHFQSRKAPWFEESKPALWQLYTEGVAMFFEQELLGDPDAFHQYGPDWKTWCDAHKGELAAEFAKRVRERESVRAFFGDWQSYRGHADIGYYLGARLIRHLSQTVSRQRLLDLGPGEVFSALEYLSREETTC